MGDKMAMIALDKVSVMVTMPADLFVRLKKMSEVTRMSKQALIIGWATDALDKAHIQLTQEGLDEVNAIIAKNIKARAARKAKKGVK